MYVCTMMTLVHQRRVAPALKSERVMMSDSDEEEVPRRQSIVRRPLKRKKNAIQSSSLIRVPIDGVFNLCWSVAREVRCLSLHWSDTCILHNQFRDELSIMAAAFRLHLEKRPSSGRHKLTFRLPMLNCDDQGYDRNEDRCQRQDQIGQPMARASWASMDPIIVHLHRRLPHTVLRRTQP